MITEIGIVSGEIWHYLDGKGEIPFSELASNIEHDRELTLMSTGWLAREGHIIVTKDGDDFRVCLRKE